MSRILIPVGLLLLSTRPVHAQWERVEVYWTGESGVHRTVSRQGSPHPLQFYLSPSAERDPSNSLCLGCEGDGHQQIKLEDFDVEKSQRILSQAFGKQIVEIVLTFRAGSAMQKANREEAEREHSSADTSPDAYAKPLAEWKSIRTKEGRRLIRAVAARYMHAGEIAAYEKSAYEKESAAPKKR
jgi:hypothetical protein